MFRSGACLLAAGGLVLRPPASSARWLHPHLADVEYPPSCTCSPLGSQQEGAWLVKFNPGGPLRVTPARPYWPYGAHDRRKPADVCIYCQTASHPRYRKTMFTLHCAACALSCQLRSSAGCSQRRIACVISPRARQLEASLIRVVNDRDSGVVCEYAMEKGPTEPRAQGPCVPVPRSHLTLPETGNTGTATQETRVPESTADLKAPRIQLR